MPRSPKSNSPRWTMPSLFSSGFSSRRTPTTTTPKEDSVKKENATPTNKGEAATPAKTTEEAGPWILLHDRNDGSPFLWNKSTGQWSLDGIAVYDPPAPATDAMGYSYYGLHEKRQQQQQQQQHQQQQQLQQYQQHQQQMCSYVQPNPAYCAPGPYAVAPHYAWQQSPTRMAPLAPGAAPVFFYGC